MHKEKHINDFGKDKISSLVLRVSIPFMIAQFVNVFYSIADRIYIGNLPDIGKTALAGARRVRSHCHTAFFLWHTDRHRRFYFISPAPWAEKQRAGKADLGLLLYSACWIFRSPDNPCPAFQKPASVVVWRQCGHFLLCRYLSYHLYLWHLFCPHGHWHELFHHCPGISRLWHDHHLNRRYFKYFPGSAVYVWVPHGHCRCCHRHRAFPRWPPAPSSFWCCSAKTCPCC